MDANVLLTKCLTLLYRESQVENATENSNELIRTTVEKIKLNNVIVGFPAFKETTSSLRNLVLEMCRNPINHPYELNELLQQIRIITNGDDNLYNAIAQGMEAQQTGPNLKRSIVSLRKAISTEFREQKIAEIVKKAHQDLGFNRHNISDISAYIRNLILELDITSSKTTAKDTAIVKSMNFSDDDSMVDVYTNVASSNSNDLAFQLGWKELNTALQGGPRPGDTVVVGALQHNYKTGASLSMFAHTAIFNKPKTKDPNKKPLLYRVTFEDPLRNNAQFLYQLLKYDETREPVDVKGISIDEMVKYVQRRMRATGYHVILEEVNPSNWTYQSLINRMIELESEGYSVEVFECDYLYKVPTTGCSQGAIGDDFLDMISRIRAYCSANGILFITPHQLSSEAKRLLQSVPPEQFLNTIKGGGYFERTKGLDRIYDIGILIHKVEALSGDYLHVVVDKHRFPTVIDSSLKSFYLPFPACKMPIPENITDENSKVHRKIPRANTSNDDRYFKMN